jgi:hypothetical protein
MGGRGIRDEEERTTRHFDFGFAILDFKKYKAPPATAGGTDRYSTTPSAEAAATSLLA